MSNQPRPVSRFPGLRKFWKPAVVTGAGGTSLVIWFEEIIAFAADFIGVILLTILGGLICLFDHFVFKSRMPRREDMENTNDKEENSDVL
jgi:hypothetical protein